MPPRRKNESAPAISSLVARFTSELTDLITAQVEQQVAEALRNLRGSPGRDVARLDGRRAGRLCPVPGCGEPGAGPRNRWFCREHSRKLSAAEQKSILERNRRLAKEGKLPTAVPSSRIVRLPPKEPRTPRVLEMVCRVDGCTNRSRGPRAGFICDVHRAQLSPDEQREAREQWKARRKEAPVAAVDEQRAAVPVPPIVRKAE
jgi:hypothetical protein